MVSCFGYKRATHMRINPINQCEVMLWNDELNMIDFLLLLILIVSFLLHLFLKGVSKTSVSVLRPAISLFILLTSISAYRRISLIIFYDIHC